MMSSKTTTTATTTSTTSTTDDNNSTNSTNSRAEGTRDDINKLMIHNFINGEFVPSTKAAASSSSSNNNNSGGGGGETETTTTKITILNPSTDEMIGEMMNSSLDDVYHVVDVASTAFHEWKKLTMKVRCSIMYRFHHLIHLHTQELAEIIVKENGKNITEAIADIAKGNETIEYACSLASSDIAIGRTIQVSSGPVYCEDRREPLGVICSIVPFNFPFMVPMWTIPIALVLGNTVILKPSEKVPLTMYRVVQLMNDAGFPKGIFNMIQGTKDVVDELIKHPKISAITFVGSSIVAKHVADTSRMYNKRVTALGGAKNHLIVIEEDVNTCRHLQKPTANDIVISFCGCAGQRCMAASVLLLIPTKTTTTTTTTISPPEEIEIEEEEELSPLLRAIIDKASKIEPGTGPKQMGPVIDKASYDKIIRYIELAETKDGAKVLLDGRKTPWSKHNNAMGGGNWIGPTILLHSKSTDVTMCEEVFGPVLSVYICRGDNNNNNNTIKTTNDNSANDVTDTVDFVPPSSWFEAIEIENRNPYGNAATIYTNDGGIADWFTKRFRAAMLGINIGIPVPREPFSFGGLYGTKSKYGDMDITGDGAVEFFTNRIKVTSKWPKITTTTTTTRSLTSITTTTTTRSSITTSSENVENGEKCKTATTITTDAASSSSSSDKDHANFAGSM